jgi:hypothetical protein
MHPRVEDAVVLDDELAASDELADALGGVGAEQAAGALGEIAAWEVAVTVALGFA